MKAIYLRDVRSDDYEVLPVEGRGYQLVHVLLRGSENEIKMYEKVPGVGVMSKVDALWWRCFYLGLVEAVA